MRLGARYSKRNPVLLEQMVLDLLAVTNYLRSRFHQEKIYLMAHSGGTFFALQASPETRSYFEQLQAPREGFYTFHQSAHSPMFEEPARLRQIIEQDVLEGSISLADRI